MRGHGGEYPAGKIVNASFIFFLFAPWALFFCRFPALFHLKSVKMLIRCVYCGKIRLRIAASELKYMVLYHGSNVEVLSCKEVVPL